MIFLIVLVFLFPVLVLGPEFIANWLIDRKYKQYNKLWAGYSESEIYAAYKELEEEL